MILRHQFLDQIQDTSKPEADSDDKHRNECGDKEANVADSIFEVFAEDGMSCRVRSVCNDSQTTRVSQGFVIL